MPFEIFCDARVFAVDNFKVIFRNIGVMFESCHTVSRVGLNLLHTNKTPLSASGAELDIQVNVSLNGSCPRIDFHATLLLALVDWGADFWVRVAATDSSLASQTFPD